MSDSELEAKFWKALAGDRVGMLGLVGDKAGHSQPMSAQILHDEHARGPIWFFTANDTDLARTWVDAHRASLHFSSKGHDLFASVEGELVVDNNRAVIDRLWNKFVAAWYRGRQGRSEVASDPLRARACDGVAQREQPRDRREAVARPRSEARLQGQGRGYPDGGDVI